MFSLSLIFRYILISFLILQWTVGYSEVYLLASMSLCFYSFFEAVFASWSRMTARAVKTESIQSQETCEVQWCMVHGRSLPANTEGWVRLQFHAGQAWVPGKRRKVSAFFLIPSGDFPPPHLEDNMLCPECVHRNKVLTKSLQWDHNTSKRLQLWL